MVEGLLFAFFSIESLSQCSERPETRSLFSTAAPPATMRARFIFAFTNQSIFDGNQNPKPLRGPDEREVWSSPGLRCEPKS